MKTVGIKCPFCGGAVEFGEGEKTATEQKKNAEDRPKKNVSRVIFFSNGFVFARMPGHGRARMRTSPIFRESAANGRTRERIGRCGGQTDGEVSEALRTLHFLRTERFLFGKFVFQPAQSVG